MKKIDNDLMKILIDDKVYQNLPKNCQSAYLYYKMRIIKKIMDLHNIDNRLSSM